MATVLLQSLPYGLSPGKARSAVSAPQSLPGQIEGDERDKDEFV
jgi:hypothetical protein